MSTLSLVSLHRCTCNVPCLVRFLCAYLVLVLYCASTWGVTVTPYPFSFTSPHFLFSSLGLTEFRSRSDTVIFILLLPSLRAISSSLWSASCDDEWNGIDTKPQLSCDFVFSFKDFHFSPEPSCGLCLCVLYIIIRSPHAAHCADRCSSRRGLQ